MQTDRHPRPWPDVVLARCFLSGLVGAAPCEPEPVKAGVQLAVLAEWLVAQEISALAHDRYGATWPELRLALQQDMFLTVAEAALRRETDQLVYTTLQAAAIPFVLLKGAALVESGAYGKRALRTMSDIDVWIPDAHMAEAVRQLQAAGFAISLKDDRPFLLQQLAHGEIRLYRVGYPHSLVELHWSAYSGWWLVRTAAIEHEQVWARKVPLQRAAAAGKTGGPAAALSHMHLLSVEDMVIQLALHVGVNHQFGMKALQGLVDIALTARTWPVDWPTVARRARRWRVATATAVVLDLLQQLFGLDDASQAGERLRLSWLRRALLRRFVSPASVLAGRDLRRGWARHLLLLLLVDRKRDMLVLIGRTLWPETAWLAARYPDGSPGRWRHLWRVLRYGQI